MVLEAKPTSPLRDAFPPSPARRYRPQFDKPSGKMEDWGAIASKHGMNVWDLIEFNFGVVMLASGKETKCRQVNWMLRQHVGCTKSDDGKNYRFDPSDKPGFVYIPDFPVPPKKRLTCADDWVLTADEERDIERLGGKPMLEWARKPPVAARESKKFRPRGSWGDDFKWILGWKSCNPAATCVFSKDRLQFIYLLHDDLDYWLKRSDTEMEAKIRQAAQEGSVRTYVQRVVNEKVCPVTAHLREVSDQKTLYFQMAEALLHMLPLPSLKAQGVRKSMSILAWLLAKRLSREFD